MPKPMDYDHLIGQFYQKLEKIVAINSELRAQRNGLSQQLKALEVSSEEYVKTERENEVLRLENEELRANVDRLKEMEDRFAKQLMQLELETLEKREMLEKSFSIERESFEKTISELNKVLNEEKMEKDCLISKLEPLLSSINDLRSDSPYVLKQALLRMKLESVFEMVNVALAKLDDVSF